MALETGVGKARMREGCGGTRREKEERIPGWRKDTKVHRDKLVP